MSKQTATTQVNEENIPALLRELDHWVVWRYEDNPDPAKKQLKVPYYVNGRKRYGVLGSEKDVEQLAPFDAALAYARKRKFDGVGLAVLPEQNLTIIDLDNCIDENGELSEFANDIVDSGVYAERSPSGRGLRAVYREALIPGQKRNFHISNGERVEVYCGAAYTTFTGNAIKDLLDNVGKVRRMPFGIKRELTEAMGSVGSGKASTAGGKPVEGLVSLNAVGLPNFTLAQARAVLKRLPAEWGAPGEGTWYRAAAALHMQFDGAEAAWEVLDEWSATREGYDYENNRKRWEAGFSHDHGRDDLTTMKSLVYKALDNGCKVSDKTMKAWGLKRSKVRSTGVDDEDAEVEALPWQDIDWNMMEQATERPPGAEPLVKNWMYRKTVVLFSSNGGAGKTYSTLTFCARVAMGLDWFGAPVTRGRVLYIGAEDELNEVSHRLWGICQHYGISIKRLRKWLDVKGLAHITRKALYIGEDFRDGEFTVQFDRLKEIIEEGNYSYVCLDNLSKFYMANENARAMVDEFVSGLAALAIEHDLAVLLLGHDSKAGDGYSGSTQWHNSARARWSLKRDERGNTELIVEKNNYGATSHGGRWLWNVNAGILAMGDEIGAAPTGTGQQEFQQSLVVRTVLEKYAQGHWTIASASGVLGSIQNHPDILNAGLTNAMGLRVHLQQAVDEGKLRIERFKHEGGKANRFRYAPPLES